MLDCCEHLSKIKSQGITFGKVACLAYCNGANVEAFRTNETSIDEFRRVVISSASSEDCHVITSYHRGTFKQTGSGHFSPIGGYHAGKDMVLILDVARFKYPPHWVPLTLLWEAMDTIDKATGHQRGFMIVSRQQKAPSILYILNCRNEGWIKVAKYLTEDIPLRLKFEDLKDVDNLLSVVFKSAPADLKEFIKWVGEVQIQEDRCITLSEEETGRLVIKVLILVFQEEVLKQIKETELFKHVTKWLASEISLCKVVASWDYKETFPEIGANICCQGAELLTGKLSLSDGTCCNETNVAFLKSGDDKPMTVVSGTVTTDGIEHKIETLVPLSRIDPSNLCDFGQSNCKGMHPSTGDVLTILLLALPQQTWSGIKEEKLRMQFSCLVSIDKVPSLLQREVLHLQRQLHFLMIDLSASSPCG
ncbi:hypothetical protein Pint_20195 [Pistacia integerrima]|uniref:Uncharacterized protein n=1 Tax=Pistacia integerrima TaxID=434235 RepID=A0ACC0XFC4_9ROSI|nr:hypothetical protein Pint_20195 [Pistacia integerrima]